MSEKAPRRGLERNLANASSQTTYAKNSGSGDVDSDVNSDARIFSPSESSIPADLAVVIKAWTFITEKAKKKILDFVKHEEAEWTESESACISESDLNNTTGQDAGSNTPFEIDRDLASFISLWPTLNDSHRKALLTLVLAQNEFKGSSPQSLEGDNTKPLSSVTARPSRPVSTKAVLPPSHPGPFSESEWKSLIDRLSLSGRQAEILRLLLDGENDKQIARRLGISLPTLRTHLQRMYTRFNVSNRTSLIVEIFQLVRTSM